MRKNTIHECRQFLKMFRLIFQHTKKELYFYVRYSEEKCRNDIEIDFLISNDSKVNYKICPIEVKSSKNYTTTSLGKFKELFGKRIERQMIIHPKNFSIENDVIKIPPYMLWCAL